MLRIHLEKDILPPWLCEQGVYSCQAISWDSQIIRPTFLNTSNNQLSIWNFQIENKFWGYQTPDKFPSRKLQIPNNYAFPTKHISTPGGFASNSFDPGLILDLNFDKVPNWSLLLTIKSLVGISQLSLSITWFAWFMRACWYRVGASVLASTCQVEPKISKTDNYSKDGGPGVVWISCRFTMILCDLQQQ